MPKSDYLYYLRNKDRLNEDYSGKVIVISEEKVIGSYESVDEAHEKASSEYTEGTYILQYCDPSSEPVLRYSLSSRRLT